MTAPIQKPFIYFLPPPIVVVKAIQRTPTGIDLVLSIIEIVPQPKKLKKRRRVRR
jgi:hypothetical protein